MDDLHDRIARIIHTHAFEETLEAEGKSMIEFQSEWSSYRIFERLPAVYQKAILAGEEELSYAGPVTS